MKSVNAMDTVLAGAKNNANTLTQPNLFKPPPKAGQLPGDEQLTVSAWSVEDVGKWLTALSLGQYRECFADSAVDGSFLYNLDESDLHNTMGIEHKLHRKKKNPHFHRQAAASRGFAGGEEAPAPRLVGHQQHQRTTELTQ